MTMFVVAVALVATVVLLRQILLADLDQRVDRELAQEADELAESIGSTQRTADETSDAYARRLLEAYLRTNVPSENEVLLAVQNGEPFLESVDPPGNLRDEVGRFDDLVVPEFVDVDDEVGDVRILAQPLVDGDDQTGVLVIGRFLEPDRRLIANTIRDASLVALGSLIAAVALAWIVAGRVLRPIGALASTARDITEHDLSRRIPQQGTDEMAAMIESFNSMLDRLQATVDMQRRFLNDAGHELRTPLTIMRGHLELAATDHGADPVADRPTGSDEIVLREVDRMTRIVDDLLVLARAEAFEFLHIGPVDADELVTRLIELSRRLGDQHWEVDELPIGVVHVDGDRLTQAMLNLAANAARHTPDGGTVAIGGRFGGGTLRLWVRDTGDGVAPGERERIFERFHRATTERSAGGSAGLGLPIVSAIARAHGGGVSLDSEVGAGSTFTITIPDRSPTRPDGAREIS